MNREEQIARIVEILGEHGDRLSDGYGYYSKDPQATLRNIAELILEAISEGQSEPGRRGAGEETQ